MILSQTDRSDSEKVRKTFEGLLGGHVAGVIAGPLRSPSEIDPFNLVTHNGLPLVVFDAVENASNDVSIDHLKGLEQVVSHFFELGHRRIGYLCCDSKFTRSNTRRYGFEQALFGYDLPIIGRDIVFGERSFEDHRPGEFDDKPPFYNEVYKSGTWPDEYWNEPGIPVPCTTPRRDLDGKEREALQATLGMVSMLDHEVGRVFQTLEKTGQLDSTLVVFTTDHGELMKHHGFWHKGLFAYDDCQRIPFLVWGADVVQKGTSNALINLVDLPKTFLDLAGIPVPQGLQGESLLPILIGEKESVQDATMIELQATKKIHQQTLVTDRYKMVLYRDCDWGELYDLQNDPDQYSNRWKDPKFIEVKTELLQRFIQFEMKKEGHVHDRVSFG